MTQLNDTIRAVFLAHGFTIKDGQTDLKPYVYEAAHALLSKLRAPVADERQPVGYVHPDTLAQLAFPMTPYREVPLYRVHRPHPEFDAKRPAGLVPIYTAPPAALASAPVAGEARPAGWQNALRIVELPEVDEALANFCDDSTKENAVGLVLAVLGAAPQVSEAGKTGPWCCERAQAQGVQVCEECAEISAGFQEAMRSPTSD